MVRAAAKRQRRLNCLAGLLLVATSGLGFTACGTSDERASAEVHNGNCGPFLFIEAGDESYATEPGAYSGPTKSDLGMGDSELLTIGGAVRTDDGVTVFVPDSGSQVEAFPMQRNTPTALNGCFDPRTFRPT